MPDVKTDRERRARFETWIRQLVNAPPTITVEQAGGAAGDGRYMSPDAALAWQAWQAALQQAQQEVDWSKFREAVNRVRDLCQDINMDDDGDLYMNLSCDAMDACDELHVLIDAQPQQRVPDWQPIETAPKDNKRPLLLACFAANGRMTSFDWNAAWESESESWEIPQVYYYWASENGYVEEPTHWAYQPETFDSIGEQHQTSEGAAKK